MVFFKTKILRGHHLFAQANSLAVGLINADVALTGSAYIRYLTPAYLGDKVIACAQVMSERGNSFVIKVNSRVGSEEVARGRFTVVAKEMKNR